MKEQSNELKPCPFCGREAAIWSSNAYRYTQSVVGCEACRIFFIDDFEENAVADWNRRVCDE